MPLNFDIARCSLELPPAHSTGAIISFNNAGGNLLDQIWANA